MATAKKKAAEKPVKPAKAAAPKAAKAPKAPKETVAEVAAANVEAAASPAPVVEAAAPAPAKKKVTPEGAVLALFDEITNKLHETESRHHQSRKLKWALKSVAMAKEIVQKHFNHL